MKQDELVAALNAAGITEGAGALAQQASPSLELIPRRSALDSLGLGASRLGGLPDVPVDFLWPDCHGRPLQFLAQLDLSECARPELPNSGWLLFFYDAIEQPWGSDPNDAGAAQVIHVAGKRSALRRATEPAGMDPGSQFPACAVTFEPTTDLPDRTDAVMEPWAESLTVEQAEAYDRLTQTVCGHPFGARYHHLLGHPQTFQADMRHECQRVTQRLSHYRHTPRDGRSGADGRRASTHWQLLLQLDSDREGPGWMWSDAGRIYFWITREDLAARAFDKAWLILQS